MTKEEEEEERKKSIRKPRRFHLGERETEVGRRKIAEAFVEGGEEADLGYVLHAQLVQHRVLVENNLTARGKTKKAPMVFPRNEGPAKTERKKEDSVVDGGNSECTKYDSKKAYVGGYAHRIMYCASYHSSVLNAKAV